MKQLPGRGQDVRHRVYVPEAYGTPSFVARDYLVSEIRLDEAGPDTLLTVLSRGQAVPVARFNVLTVDHEQWLLRLFRDPPKQDRETIMGLMDDLEDAVRTNQIEKARGTRRLLLGIFHALAADVATFAPPALIPAPAPEPR